MNVSRSNASTAQKRVLVIEDDSELRALLIDVLERDGHDVRGLASATELLETLDEAALDTLDMIVTDIRMRGASGLDLLGALRAMGCPTPLVVMSAFGDELARGRAFRLGAFAFLEKPFDPSELCELVRAAPRRSN